MFSCADLIKLECERFHIGENFDDTVFSKQSRKELSVFYHRRELSSVDNGADYNLVLIDVKVHQPLWQVNKNNFYSAASEKAKRRATTAEFCANVNQEIFRFLKTGSGDCKKPEM